MPKIPSQVFLYISKSKNDLVLMNVTEGDETNPGLTFTSVTIPAGQEATYTISKPPGPSEGTPFGQHAVRDKNGTVVGKRFKIHKDIIARSPDSMWGKKANSMNGNISPNPKKPGVAVPSTAFISILWARSACAVKP